MPPDLFSLTRPAFSPASAAAALGRLEVLASFLEDSRWFPEAQAIRDFLFSRYRSLDETFGLVQPRRPKGAPNQIDQILRLGHLIERLLLEGKTWAGVADRLSDAAPHANGMDEKYPQRIYGKLQKLREQWWSLPLMTAEQTGQILDLVGPPDRHSLSETPRKPSKSKVKKSTHFRPR
jgi:hypothetical protein